jgi:hypothetical protein
MKKRFLVLLFLLPLLCQAQDWPIKGTPAWPDDQKDLNDTCDVIPIGVDFGLCDMALGWALTDSGCVVLSGCGWIGSNGIDYTSSFFSSSYECNSACLQDTVVMLSCIDSNLIDPQIFCGGALDPVCGCDSVTYQNWCQAQYYHGITSYYQGACVTTGNQKTFEKSIVVYPNPSKGQFHIDDLPVNAHVNCTNLLGKVVYQTDFSQKAIDLDLSYLPKGCYLLTANGILVEKLLIE